MAGNGLFDRNLHALSHRNRELYSRLSKPEISVSRYTFRESRSGEIIPSLLDSAGTAHPLHSTIDPRKEAKRLIDSITAEGFIIFFGLGGAYYAEAALERDNIGMVLVVEYDVPGIAELLNNIDYTRLFEDPRFCLVVDSGGEDLTRKILELYQPVLFGGIRIIPLRARTDLTPEIFIAAGKAVEAAIDKVSSDYSVQVHFGKRWLSNVIRNLKSAGGIQSSIPPVRKAAVCAAGPSLSLQIPVLREKRETVFLIATDTGLPCLLNAGIPPDAVISMDCQHISYYHFMYGLPEETLLFLDLASPPLLATRSEKIQFFTGSHPLTKYICRVWKPLPELDTSGGNVTYAALSLAEQLGASEIELYGADFSYPSGISYARGTYIYSLFEKHQNRLSPLEAQASSFLYRTPLEKKRGNNSWYYENQTLKFYRERLEEKSGVMEAAVVPIEGKGAPVNIQRTRTVARAESKKSFSSGKAISDSEEFLLRYKNEIAGLPTPEKNAILYIASLDNPSRSVFTTILPVAAALKKRLVIEDFRELLEVTKAFCIKEIDRVLAQ